MQKKKYNGILIIGATGTGKTPFGNLCEKKGVWGTYCIHFDFGSELRKIAALKEVSQKITEKDLSVIFHVLKTGELLENENFQIAEKILVAFVERKKLSDDGFILLNGLPRHIDQARDVDRIVDIQKIIHLECSANVVYERIFKNSGGDRAGRCDDSADEIRNKLELFKKRTFPLLKYYQQKGIEINNIPVEVNHTAEDIHECLLKWSLVQ